MANSDKNIVITPNRNSSTADPQIVFSGANATLGPQNITIKAYPTNNGTVSFEGSAGQLFSITNDLSGTIFSVNDVSGIPSIEVLDTGALKINSGYGLRLNALGNVSGSVSITMSNGSYITATVTGNVTLTFTSIFASGTGSGFILQLTNGGNYSITWPASVRWPNGVAPSLTPNGTDILSFTTVDGGSNWRGVVSMYDSK